ncbi:WG repeat-containing protein [Denitrobaculum tricleocarpae]|uniref:WG repeat-containing protein n=1 Tax=Denitrobaculum tricleocarpae TaxID=2591009 RepID=A0A545T0A1_9PROT|nr:WG repeat-containing protein [Denitrobaculum tricleocarpae]TQV70630.1 WG repeat-containing protein [Denitrobaculum tricleocarpae]
MHRPSLRVILLSLLLVMSLVLVLMPARDDRPERVVVDCGGASGLCGYVLHRSKTEVIPQRYERAMPFSEGLAAVLVDGRFGYIDLNGEMVLEPRFDLAGAFEHGLAEVLMGEHTGVINRKGEVVVAPKFARSIPFTEDVVLVREGEWADSRAPAKAVLKRDALLSGNMGLYRTGEYQEEGWITKPHFTFSFFAHAGEGYGLIWAQVSNTRGALFGLMRADGSWQVEPAYTMVQRLNAGRAVVRMGPWPSKERYRAAGTKLHLMAGYAGAVDENGVLVVPTEYESLSYFHTGGYGLVQRGEQYGFLDRSGRLLGGKYFDEVERPTYRRPPRGRINGVWYDLESTDEPTTSVAQSRMTKVTHELVPASASIDTAGSRREGPPSSSLDCPGGGKIFRSGEFWGFKDPSGEETIAATYPAMNCFYGERAWVPIESRQRWCQIGSDGALLEQSECRAEHYPFTAPQHVPERFDPDPYTNSVLWTRAFLEHGEDNRKRPPRVIGKGSDGSRVEISIRCRSGSRCD